MFEDFWVPFIVISLAELGDKTQLSVLLLSSRTHKHLQLLAGVVLAFLIVDGVAVLAGSWITSFVSHETLRTISGVVFLAFGVFILVQCNENEESKFHSKNPFLAGFMLILLTEWGDKTQIAAALFATKYSPWLVMLGTIAALTVLSAMAVYLGKHIAKRIDRKLMTKIAGALFITIGIVSLLL